MDKLGEWILPAAVALIVLFGWVRRVPVFDEFLQGAKQGLSSSISILPTLIGLMMGVAMLEASGALDLAAYALTPLAEWAGFPWKPFPLDCCGPFPEAEARRWRPLYWKRCLRTVLQGEWFRC